MPRKFLRSAFMLRVIFELLSLVEVLSAFKVRGIRAINIANLQCEAFLLGLQHGKGGDAPALFGNTPLAAAWNNGATSFVFQPSDAF